VPEQDITDSDALLDVLQSIREDYKRTGKVSVSWKCEGVRTDQQRKAIEVFCRMLAGAFNAQCFDQRKVLAAMKDGTEIPWDQDSVKNSIWRQIQVAVLQKESTTKLAPAEVSRVYNVINKFTIERFNISVPFPDRFGPQE